MLSGIALKIALGFGLIGAATGAWFYVQTIRAELDAANERTARAMDVVNEQAATLDKLQEDIKLIQNITQELGKKMADAEKSVVDLNNKFDELVTGAQPLPDEVNGQCPDLVPGSLPTKTEEKVDIRKTVK
jgi:predicted nuclease with TOPRIM domain